MAHSAVRTVSWWKVNSVASSRICVGLSRRDADDPTDAHLLQRFVEQRDEAAFTALVQRHGALVLGVCRRVLGHPHDAEDAFQATFLVLVRRAGAIRKHTSVRSWLYSVAYRVAGRSRVPS